ncbi:hypothetical protein [Nocardia sp. NPDC051570]|uniref:hypothetical protein n=1 Tax=Nocardia sp. NPDC051570 TaxID=3364324 RepID=UPI00379B08D1
MSYKNAFTGGSGAAESAEHSARQIYEKIPGAWPERKGVDPELYDDIPDAPRDPKIVNEMSPGALNIVGNVLTPLFQNFQTVAADQLRVSENPASTSTMASSTQAETSKNMKAEVNNKDKA